MNQRAPEEGRRDGRTERRKKGRMGIVPRCHRGAMNERKRGGEGLGFYKMSVFDRKSLQSDFRFVLYGAEFASESKVGRKYRANENECVSICYCGSCGEGWYFETSEGVLLGVKSPETAKKFAENGASGTL